MDNNVYKRHLFEVYSFDEEEIEDINELQEKFKSEREENCPMFGLEVKICLRTGTLLKGKLKAMQKRLDLK